MPLLQFYPPNGAPPLQGIGEKLAWYFQDTATFLLFISIPLGLLLYYWIAGRVGFRSPAQIPFAVHKPPRDLPATAIHYIYKKGFDTKCLLIAVINAGLKGCYRIRWTPKGFLAVLSKDADFSQLSKEERKALTIYSDKYWEKVIIAPNLSKKTRRMGKRMEKYMRLRYRKLFLHKLIWKIIGPVLALGLCFFLFSQAEEFGTMRNFVFYAAVFVLFIVVPVVFLMQVLKDRYIYGIVHSCIYMTVGLFVLIYIESKSNGPLYSASVLPVGLIVFWFNHRLSTYSFSGDIVMSEIEAYRESLKVRMEEAEAAGGDFSHMTSEIPYMLALDLDGKFTEYFDPLLSRTKYEPYQIFNQIHRN